MPSAWNDLITGLTLLSREQNDDVSPLRCVHDTLFVAANPDGFTVEEITLLDSLGFYAEDNGFYSFRFGG